MAWTIFFISLAILAYIASNRSGAKDPKAGLFYVAGYATVFLGILVLLVFGIPQLLMVGPGYTQKAWQPVVSQVGNDVSAAGANLRPYLGVPAVPTSSIIATPQPIQPEATAVLMAPASGTHTVQAGETLAEIANQYGVAVMELVNANAITNPNRIMPGQVLIIPGMTSEPIQAATAEATPVQPQPTATALVVNPVWYDQLAQARADGRQGDGQAVIDQILAINPNDEQVLAALVELQQAQALWEAWQVLAEREGDGYGWNKEARHFVYGEDTDIRQYLGGYTFQITEVEDFTGLHFAPNWNEKAVVQVVSPGWLYGRILVIARGHANLYGAANAGEQFAVPVGGGS